MAEQRDLPPILDFSDELDRLEAEADADVSEEVEELRSRLDDLAGRVGEGADAENAGSVVDDAESALYRLREQVSGEADKQAEALENRLGIYKNSTEERSGTLSLSQVRFEDATQGEVDPSRNLGETLTFAGSLTNAGDLGDVRVRLSFYDHDDRLVRTVELVERDVEPDESRRIGRELLIPEPFNYYDASVLEGDGRR
jgi:hypothetical protein